MTDRISEFTMQKWKALRPNFKVSPKGWVHANAPCCVHRGETMDKRSRGAFKLLDDGIAYHCFNCALTTKYVQGQGLSKTFKNLLKWIGATDNEIGKLILEDLRLESPDRRLTSYREDEKVLDLDLEPKPLPDGFRTFEEWSIDYDDNVKQYPKLADAFSYALSRMTINDIIKYRVGYTPIRDIKTKLHSRIVIPYTWHNKIVGYTSRDITGNTKPKYLSQIDSDYIFGMDFLTSTSRFVFVVEGVLDAISLGNAVAVLSNTISKVQADLINNTGKVVVAIPDYEKSGKHFVESALEHGWHVSFPQWAHETKDADSARAKYGKLYTVKDIIDNICSGSALVKVRMREFMNE